MSVSALDRVDVARLPRVDVVGGIAMALTAASVIYIAATIGRHVTLVPSIVLTSAASVALLAAFLLLATARGFAWHTFRRVAGWTLVAYLVIAGMLEYVFLYDDMRGGRLALMTLALLIFALSVPLEVGYGTARFDDTAAA